MKVRTALFISILASQANAAEWLYVGGNTKIEAFLDVQSVRRTGTRAKVWVKWVHATPVALRDVYPERMYSSSKTLEIYDCAERSSTTIQQILYAEEDGGEVVKSYSIPEKSASFEEVVPESIGESLLGAACNRSTSKK